MRPGQSAGVVTDATRAAVDAATAEHEPACARAVARELRRLVRDAVAAFEASTRIVHAGAFASDPDWVPPEYHVPISSDLIDEMAANESLDATTRKYREATIRTTGEAIAGDLSVQFDVSNRLLTGVIASQSGMKIVTAPRDLVGVMMGSLQESYDNGHSIPRAARGMREAGYAHSKPMAERIARTEVVGASNSASLAMVRGGTDLRFKSWIATGDALTRPEHAEADGQVVPIDGLFDVGGEGLDCPGDGSAWNSINCRCSIGYQDTPGELNTLGPTDPLAVEPPSVAVEPPATWGYDNGPTLGSDEALERGQFVRDAMQARIDEGNLQPGDPLRDRMEALNAYTSPEGEDMNKALRGQLGDMFKQTQAERMDAMFDIEGEHAVLQRDTLVFRGLSAREGAFVPGEIATERGFVSTSGNSEIAKDFATDAAKSRAGQEGIALRLHIPAGERFLIGFPDEAEIILRPGTRYLILPESEFPIGGHVTHDVIVLRPGETAATATARIGLSS